MKITNTQIYSIQGYYWIMTLLYLFQHFLTRNLFVIQRKTNDSLRSSGFLWISSVWTCWSHNLIVICVKCNHERSLDGYWWRIVKMGFIVAYMYFTLTANGVWTSTTVSYGKSICSRCGKRSSTNSLYAIRSQSGCLCCGDSSRCISSRNL